MFVQRVEKDQLPTPYAPSLKILLEAEAYNNKVGHENRGFLSSSSGFMPKQEPLQSLPKTFQVWEELREATPLLIKNQSFRKTVGRTAILLPTSEVLPEKYLHRASLLLGFFAHAYVNSEGDLLSQNDVPSSIMQPWKMVSSRLERSEPFLSYFDLIAYNWRYKKKEEPIRSLENMDLLYPIFDCREEQILYLIQTEMMAQASPMVRSVANAQEALLQNDHDTIFNSLDTMIDRLNYITNTSFAKLSYSKRSASHMDPIVFTKTMMSFAVPIKKGVPGPSGTAFPYAHLLDIFTGRKKYNETISKEALAIRKRYPPHVKAFLDAVSKISMQDYIQKSSSIELKLKYSELIEAYSGDQGFLNTHRKRVYGFIETSFKVGRPQTIGGFQGEDNEEEWAVVDNTLAKMRKERPLCPFAHQVSENSDSKSLSEKKPDKQLKALALSLVVQYSSEEKGYWIIINNHVLDVTQYIKKHPGGETSLIEYAGSDATKDFLQIHKDSTIAQRIVSKLTIGKLIEPSFLHKEMLNLWEVQKKVLFKITELYNIFKLEVSIENKACFPNEDLKIRTPYKKYLIKNSIKRFENTYSLSLQKSAKNLSDWLNTFVSDCKIECPFPRKNNTQQHLLDNTEEESPLKFLNALLGLKEKAIQITKLLEQPSCACISPKSIPMNVVVLLKKEIELIQTIS